MITFLILNDPSKGSQRGEGGSHRPNIFCVGLLANRIRRVFIEVKEATPLGKILGKHRLVEQNNEVFPVSDVDIFD